MASTYTRPQLEKLKVTELKDILRSNGQKMSGSKVELIDRIMATQPKKITARSPKKTTAPKKGQKTLASPPRVPTISSSLSRGSIVPAVISSPRRSNLSDMAIIKSMLYAVPQLRVDWENVPPAILTEISWAVDDPLTGAQLNLPEEAFDQDIDPDEYFLPFTDAKKHELNHQVIESPTHTIYVDGVNILDPNASAADEYVDYGGYLELVSPNAHPLTQWQVLKALEQYYQWYMAQHGGHEAIGDHRYFEGLSHIGNHNGIPVYRLSLGS